MDGPDQTTDEEESALEATRMLLEKMSHLCRILPKAFAFRQGVLNHFRPMLKERWNAILYLELRILMPRPLQNLQRRSAAKQLLEVIEDLLVVPLDLQMAALAFIAAPSVLQERFAIHSDPRIMCPTSN